jgi:putative ABC transport system ATP-binding protein
VSVLIAEGVSKRHGTQWVLSGVDLRLEPGRLVLVGGRSGSGKSTLFSVLSGLEAPSSGRVLFAGRDLAAMGEQQRADFRLRESGLVFQDFRLLPDLTVRENVRLPLELARRGLRGPERERYSRRAVQQRVAVLLERLGLSSLGDRFPETLSGGEQQRVAVARALANDPGVVLADEPTANLDEENAHEVMGMLRDAARAGRVVMVVAHDPVARGYADEAFMLRAGGLVRIQDGGAAAQVPDVALEGTAGEGAEGQRV